MSRAWINPHCHCRVVVVVLGLLASASKQGQGFGLRKQCSMLARSQGRGEYYDDDSCPYYALATSSIDRNLDRD
jgi:hypothetical protein